MVIEYMATHYFPDPDVPALQPFTQAFVRMMFAHAEFERGISDLMDLITGIVGFGERPSSLWQADKRPKLMKKLINEHRPDGLPEKAHIVACLKRSISFFRVRNLLAHGIWWEFDEDTNSITVRSGVKRRNEDQHRTFTVAEIQDTANSLNELEAELWNLKRAIEAGAPGNATRI
jgi:hypothetical protein